MLNALTCAFVPLAGLEPAPYGLEVRHDPSAWCWRGESPQVESSSPSAWLHPGQHGNNDRIAKGIASLMTGHGQNVKSNRWTPTSTGFILGGAVRRARSTADNSTLAATGSPFRRPCASRLIG